MRAVMVSTGITVALSNPRTGDGFLGLFTSDYVLQFRGMVRTAVASTRAPSNLLLWFEGGALVPKGSKAATEINAETMALRRLVARELDAAGFRLVHGGWLEVGKCLNMALRCGTDRCIVNRMDDPYPR